MLLQNRANLSSFPLRSGKIEQYPIKMKNIHPELNCSSGHTVVFFYFFFATISCNRYSNNQGWTSDLCEMYSGLSLSHRNWNPVVRHMVLIKMLIDMQPE